MGLESFQHLHTLPFETVREISIIDIICRRVDPFSRLRVPRYLKAFEALFFVVFLGLYYSVLVQRNHVWITTREIILLVWIAAFALDEFGQYADAGLRFYAVDFWSLWDVGIVAIGVAFFMASKYERFRPQISFTHPLRSYWPH